MNLEIQRFYRVGMMLPENHHIGTARWSEWQVSLGSGGRNEGDKNGTEVNVGGGA